MLDVSGLTGILDFSAAECTFTARPGTPIAAIDRLLSAHGLYLPFEPPLAARGATIGGTVAAGLSGPGRFRYGGVRDFLLGVHFVDSSGRVVSGGGRVVKNAAGFSLHHLMLGSLGRLGVLVDVTCKVFPRPAGRVTLIAQCGTLAAALDTLVRLRRSTFELDAAELLPSSTLLLRMAGLESALDERAAALEAFLAPAVVRRLPLAEADELWEAARELADIVDANHASRPTASAPRALVKVAITPSRIAALEARLPPAAAGDVLNHRAPGAPDAPRQNDDVSRRYSAGGDLAWIGWPGPLTALDRILHDVGLSGLVLIDEVRGVDAADTSGAPLDTRADARAGAAASGEAAGPLLRTGAPAPPSASASPCCGGAFAGPFIGTRPDESFLRRVRAALDPHGRFA